MSPECVCVVLAQNNPQIFLYSMLKLSLFEGLQKRTFCVWPFKCKWAAAEGGVSRACVLAAAISSSRYTKMTETVLPL